MSKLTVEVWDDDKNAVGTSDELIQKVEGNIISFIHSKTIRYGAKISAANAQNSVEIYVIWEDEFK